MNGYSVATIALLQAVSPTVRSNGMALLVNADRKWYQFEAGSVDPDGIVPNVGTGRWMAIGGDGSGDGSGGDVTALQDAIYVHESRLNGLDTTIDYLQTNTVPNLESNLNSLSDNLTALDESKAGIDEAKGVTLESLWLRRALLLGYGAFNSGANATTFTVDASSLGFYFGSYYPGATPDWIVTGLVRIVPPVAQLQIPEIEYTTNNYGDYVYKITLPGNVPVDSVRVIFERYFISRNGSNDDGDDRDQVRDFVDEAYDYSNSSGGS